MYSLEIPICSLKELWKFKPITTALQKDLCKSFFEDNSNDFFIEYINTFLRECTHPSHDIFQLSIIDKLIILIKLRCASIGSTTEFEAERDNKKAKITYSFTDVLVDIYNIAEQQDSLTVSSSNIVLKCNIPKLDREIDLLKISAKESITYEDIIPFFIESIKIQNKTIEFKSLPYAAQLHTINALPAILIQDVHSYILNIIEQYSKVILYNFNNTEVKFNFIGALYNDYIKFLYRENMYKIYQEIYILSKHINMNAEYIEKMTPLEREMYISFFKQENKASSNELPANQEIPITNTEVPVSDFSLDSLDEYKNIMGG